MTAPRVAVVGGGAVGVTAAFDLAERGATVTLYERDRLASGASGRAAGIVYDAFAEDVDVAVADRALERFQSFDRDGLIECTPCPYVWFAREGDDTQARAIRDSVERMQAHDRDVDCLSGDALGARFPGLDTADVAVAAVANAAGYLDPTTYVEGVADRASDAGAVIRTGTDATVSHDGNSPAVTTDAGRERFDAVLVAAGAHTKRLLSAVGVDLAVKPYRVQALVTEPMGIPAGGERVPAVWDATDSYYLRPHSGGLLYGDGTEEREFDPDAYDVTADEDFLASGPERIRGLLADGAGDAVSVARSWAGLCTATPDRDPLLGPVVGMPGVYVATGWHGHGFMRAPATGERIAKQILGGDGIEAFDPNRFDGDEQFQVVEGMTVDEGEGGDQHA